MLCRCEAFVSPVLRPTRISGAAILISSAIAVISESGPARFLSMSLESAFNGETYTICVTSSSPESSPSQIRSSMHFRKAASVFSRPRRCRDQRVLPLRYRLPALRLGLRRPLKLLLKPSLYNWMKKHLFPIPECYHTPPLRPVFHFDEVSTLVYNSAVFEIVESPSFKDWIRGLRDRDAKNRINGRLKIVSSGNLGDVRSVGQGLWELRIRYGPGYRVYFIREGLTIIVFT